MIQSCSLSCLVGLNMMQVINSQSRKKLI